MQASDLVGRHVLEVGRRESLPFITFGNGPVERREVRLVIDARYAVELSRPATGEPLEELMYLSVVTVEVADGELRLAFGGGARLVVSAEREVWTGDAPWTVSDEYTTPLWPPAADTEVVSASAASGDARPAIDDQQRLQERNAVRRGVVQAVLWATTHGPDLARIVSAAPTRRDALEELMRPPHDWTEHQAHHVLDITFGRLSQVGVAALREELEQLHGGEDPSGRS